MNRVEQAARWDKATTIARTLNRATELIADVLARIDDDAEWFRVWTFALGIGARCPSDETRQLVRSLVLARLPLAVQP